MTRQDIPVARPAAVAGPRAVKRVYRMAGLIMGGIWAWNAGEPVWEHALKFGLLLFVGVPLLHLVQKRRTAGRPRPGPQLSLARAVVAKGVLLAAALVASYLLRSTPHGDLYVAAGLFVAIAGIGPLLHRHLMAG
ncbi:hypothetical protein F8568_009625 [Actinomadura sp. LD22]|uniref:DUF2568 domain-containing protein n=1 Tax=Actinomadura physcomitrii TaxID=2650748 RepID=A0A6I4M4E8_9ACTN|nr:hypothetical protein [Actinomadura physcomitrii]MWA00633.1 hypothetical protein [Actinomadura physcomitrii]